MKKTTGGSRAAFWFISTCMFLAGVQIAETGAALERMSLALGLGPAQEGLLVSVRFAGGVVSGLIVWAGAAGRISTQASVAAALIATLGSGLLLLWPTYPTALVIGALRGLAVGAFIPLSGMFAARQDDWDPGLVASTVNAALSFGLVALSGSAALIARFLLLPWQVYWALASVGSLPLLLMLPRIRFPGPREQELVTSRARRGDLLARTSWVLAAAGFLVVGGEGVLVGLVPVRSAGLSNTSLTGETFALLLMSGFFVGRVAGSFLHRRVRSETSLLSSTTALLLSGLLWSLSRASTPAAVVLLGLAGAGLFPSLIAFTAQRSAHRAGTTIAAMAWAGGAGGTLWPFLAGLSLELGMPGRLTVIFVALPVLTAVFLVRHAGRKPEARR